MNQGFCRIRNAMGVHPWPIQFLRFYLCGSGQNAPFRKPFPSYSEDAVEAGAEGSPKRWQSPVPWVGVG